VYDFATAEVKGLEQSGAHVGPVDRGPKLAELLASADRGLRFIDRPELARLVNWSSTRDAPIHRWLRYREAYSAELIEALDLGRSILDPFCGCGSILVGAASGGGSSTGIDINPLATFSARVKTSPLTARQRRQVSQFCDTLVARLPRQAEPWLPPLSIAKKVFEPQILEALLQIREVIWGAQLEDGTRDFLWLAWVAILEKVGSYFKEGNGIKYRNVQRRPGKYVPRVDGEWQRKRFGADQHAFTVNTFLSHVALMLQDVEVWTKGWGETRVIEGNALDLCSLTLDDFDSIIFSPPYANRFDYFESMKVELWFGGFASSSEHMRSLRKGSLRSHLAADMRRPLVHFPILEQIIGCMNREASSWRMGVPQLLRGYFSDIVTVLEQCRRRLRGESCYVVVGNSAFGGAIIPSDSLTAMAGRLAGFSSSEILVTRHLTVAPQQRAQLAGLEGYMRESIVALRV
jgi:site-specific DNA-methyltransferase (adenine-specific)